NSHYLSHFAAFFIDARTKRSVVESFDSFVFCLAAHSEETVKTKEFVASGGRLVPGRETEEVPGAGAAPPKQRKGMFTWVWEL
ncbi:hypothetical protein, partial [Streptomyces sp. NPDC013187]